MCQIESDLQEFKENIDVSSNSLDNYVSSLRKFYSSLDRSTPIEPESNIDKVSTHLEIFVTSRSMKYALLKYFKFKEDQAESYEGIGKMRFLIKMLKRLEYEDTEVEDKVLKKSRIDAICNQAEGELNLLLRVMYETATRVSGVRFMKWKDLDRKEFKGEPLTPTQIHVSSDRSKSKIDGVVEISEDSKDRLEHLREKRCPTQEEYIFFPDIKRDSVYRKIWRHFSQPETPNYFRHSRLTHLAIEIHKNENIPYELVREKVRKYARHKDSDSTEIYIKKARELMDTDLLIKETYL